jgi:8-oxo-dGTP pyrophosphatase MutT (NUDIX family)
LSDHIGPLWPGAQASILKPAIPRHLHGATILKLFTAGLKALLSGFMDPVQGIDGAIVAEKAATAALREAAEETGISQRPLLQASL